MMEFGSSKDNMDYEGITIEYFSNVRDAQDYLNYRSSRIRW